MRAVGYQHVLAIHENNALLDIEVVTPTVVSGHDLLVKVEAVSVNPVDTKIRKRSQPKEGEYKILGWDAAGIVTAVGDLVQHYKVGDEVFYAGDLTRQGTNAEYHVVDERIVGYKPKTLSFEQAAALPLTSITAWETLFDRLRVNDPIKGQSNSILVIGGSGGVGSIAIQLLHELTDLKIIATASRAESKAWCEKLGAHHVLDHRQSLAQQFTELGLAAPSFVFSTTNTADHLPDIAHLIAPQGRFALIDDPEQLNFNLFKTKSVSLHWELMFTRSMFNTPDISEQATLLNEVSKLVDAGKIQSTLAESFGKINAANLKKAHAQLETGHSLGKIVLSGF